jgi:dimethylaniline monooxygenase (N-oxide forming)
LSPASFRLSGPDAEPDAPLRTAAAAAAFGAVTSETMTSEEAARLKAVLDLSAAKAA